MEKNTSELIYDAFEKSRHKGLIDKFLPKRFNYSLGIIGLFSVIIGYFSRENLVAYFIFLFIYACWLIYELETISKEVNDKIRTDKFFEGYNNDELYYSFGQKDLKIFNKKFYTFNNTEYSQLIYFNCLLSKEKITKTEIINFITNLKFKTKDYKPITEKGIFNTFIALFISLSVLGLDKLVIATDKWTSGAWAGLILTILLYILLLMFIYGFLQFFQRKAKKEKDIIKNLEYFITRNMLKN